MNADQTQLLLVEDNPADAELTAAVLTAADVEFELTTAGSFAAAVEILRSRDIDAVVLDLNLPDMQGIETLRAMRREFERVAIVVVSGSNPPGLRQDVLREGAQDYIWKNEPDTNFLARCILYAVERFRAQEAHRQVRQLIDANPDSVIVVDGDGIVRYVNMAATELFARGADDLIGEWLGFSAGDTLTEIQILGYDEPRTAEMRVAEIKWQGEPAVLASIRDVTENRQLAKQLREAQNMEMIGLLAGGIAHDFNNLLVVIMGNIEFLKEECAADDPRLAMVLRMDAAAERARHLTRQLLVLSSRQGSRPVVTDPNEIVMKLYEMLRRSFPNDIELVVLPGDGVWNVRVDPSEFDQIMMNLTFNAKHALPQGGRIQFDVQNNTLSQPFGALEPGDYVRFRVTDDGVGIAPDHISRIFEPFFTTRTAGTGTGLGLAICQGIARKAGGDIHVQSTLGEGSTFTILVPRCFDEIHAAAASMSLPASTGNETILVVEDDAGVSAAVSHALTSRGFQVINAANGEQATRILEHDPPPDVDLVLSDVVMPQMGGLELNEWLKSKRPTMKILLTTGYANNVSSFEEDEDTRLILFKPFTPADLVRTIRMLLDR